MKEIFDSYGMDMFWKFPQTVSVVIFVENWHGYKITSSSEIYWVMFHSVPAAFPKTEYIVYGIKLASFNVLSG